MVTLGGPLGGFFVLLLDVARLNFRVNPYLHGSARWADLSDIKAAGLLNNDGVYVGAWRDKRGKIHYLRHAGPEHVLCYAPTRSGKGVGLILPTLLSWKQSVFVTDLKGELYELTAGWRHEQPTIAFCGLNPPRPPVPVALTRWRNCVLGPSTK